MKRQKSSKWIDVIFWTAIAIDFWSLFFPQFVSGFQVQRVILGGTVTELTGTIITFLGLGFTVWARVHLGKNWSSMPAIKVGHELIRSGPYNIVRHPIYSGLLFGLAGTAIIIGELLAVVAFFLILFIFLWKIWTEEKYLLLEFGEVYAQYKREVPALIPFLV